MLIFRRNQDKRGLADVLPNRDAQARLSNRLEGSVLLSSKAGNVHLSNSKVGSEVVINKGANGAVTSKADNVPDSNNDPLVRCRPNRPVQSLHVSSRRQAVS